MAHPKNDIGGDTLTQDDIRTKKPRMYKVILLNDDYTSMEFVVSVLRTVFHKSMIEAEQIMFAVHTNGKGVAGVFTREIAETKVAIVQQLARQQEFPLRCTLEPE